MTKQTKYLIVIITLIAIAGVADGILAGVLLANHRNYHVTQYKGVGSDVFKSGTLLDDTSKTNPGTVVGHIDAPGTWVIESN